MTHRQGPRPAGLFVALLAVSAVASAGCEPEPETVVVEGTAVEHGASLFRDPAIARTSFNDYACATCHEPTAAADDSTVLRPGAPLGGVTERPSYWGGQELELLRAVNHCLYYFMLKDQAWTADDVEARAMYAYLSSISVGGGRDAVPFTVVEAIVDLAPGDAARGSAVYDRACASCHGTAHTGAGRLAARAPVLPEQTVEEHASPEYTATERRLVFIEKTRHGGFLGYGGQMPPFSREKLPDSELADLLTFFALY